MERLIRAIKTIGDKNAVIGCVLNLDSKAIRLSNGLFVTSKLICPSVRRIDLHYLEEIASHKDIKMYLDAEDINSLKRSIIITKFRIFISI